MYKEDLALNNLQWLICHKTQPTKQHKSEIEIKLFKNIAKNMMRIAILETFKLRANKSSGSFQNVIYKMCLQYIYIYTMCVCAWH